MTNIPPKSQLTRAISASQIPLRNFSDYFLETIATGYENQIQITSKCNAKCVFCSNEQNPFEVKRCAFREVSEIEKVVWSLPHSLNGPICLNESLPGRISEGEAFSHPNLFEILRIIRNKFPFILIKITTNGSMLTLELIDKLKNFNPIEVSISTSSINKDFWQKTYNLSDKHYDIALNASQLLIKNKIGVVINLVPMPSFVGWEDLERTFKFFAPIPFYIYAPGYTKYTKGDLKKFEYDKIELSDFLDKMSKKYNFIYEWTLDPRLSLDLDHKNIIQQMKNIFNNGGKNILWLTSVAAKDRMEKQIKTLGIGIPVNNTILDVKNHTYGGNIEVAGLLVLRDVEKTINEYLKYNKKPDMIFIPRMFLDKFGFDLLGDNVLDLFKRFDVNFFVL